LCAQGKPQEPVKMKDEKELKPVSMRVRDAAESLLTIILEQVRIHRNVPSLYRLCKWWSIMYINTIRYPNCISGWIVSIRLWSGKSILFVG